jgi:hypothetical protein
MGHGRPPEGAVEFWHETAVVDLPRVTYDTFTRNLRTGEATVNRDVLEVTHRTQLTYRCSINSQRGRSKT